MSPTTPEPMVHLEVSTIAQIKHVLQYEPDKMNYDDTEPLTSQTHHFDRDWTTHIQIGKTRFYLLERLVDWFYLLTHRPKFTKANLVLTEFINERCGIFRMPCDSDKDQKV